MAHEDELAQIQNDILSLKRLTRQLLELVAVVREEPAATLSAPTSTPSTPPTPLEDEATAPTARTRDTRPITDDLIAPLYAENARLIDLVRAQAEELGALRERVQALDAAQAQPPDPRARARALQALLQALQDPS